MNAGRQVFLAAVFTLVGGVLSFVATVLNPQLWKDLPFAQPEVQIARPSDGEGVGTKFVVQGTAENLRAGETLWAVVQPTDTNRFFPSDGPCLVDTDGKWNCPVFTLAPYDPSATGFRILAIRANALAVSGFFAYEVNRPEGEFPGLNQLPDGAVIAAATTVQQLPG